MAAKAKPFITANMVTAVRLLAMPLIAWLIYESAKNASDTQLWFAVGIGTVVGSTDFVDGYLARKYGPTVLGGMLDPLADKVFIALVYLPFMHLHLFPTWAVGLLFVREFLVTSIRSAYEWRGLQLKTSYFGKVKTWVQMQGLALIILSLLVSHTSFVAVAVVGTVAPALALAYFWLARKEFSPNNLLGTLFMGLVVFLYTAFSRRQGIDYSIYIICLLTWLSGFDYLAGALPALRKAGGFHRADLVRLLGAIATPATVVLALMHSSAPALPVLAVVVGELASGGLDNLLSRHHDSASALSVGARSLGSALCLFLCWVIKDGAALFAWLAMAISIAGTIREFWRGRRHYLDDSKWDEELVEG